MMKLKKVCACGHFGFDENLLNGQTIKTKIVTTELERRLGAEEVYKLDTHGGIKAAFKLPLQILKAMRICKNIVIFPAKNGLRVLVPLLSFGRLFFRRKLHYVVIGGWLPGFVKNKKILAKQLKKFDGIYVETNTMKNALEEQGFRNVKVMPNCKKLTSLTASELVYADGEPYKLCTFSRVMKEKGIEDAVRAVKAVNERLGRTVYELDIYGQIDASQSEWFDNLQKEFPPYIRYGGLVPFDKSVETLKNYFALLFPTYYEGEGFAGTVIDAFAAGIPVIASDWRYNSEIISSDVGKLFPTHDVAALADILENCSATVHEINELKYNCISKAAEYSTSRVIGDFIKHLD